MPSPSGRIVKTSKRKGGTAHHKNHRWESFTAKIAKLNSVDPLRRVQRYDLDTEDLSSTTSYFRNSLEKWQELNVSGRFVDFTNQIMPLCDSLPQILHFENKIMDLLVAHLEAKEREAVEPLLQLLADFAHDLGTRFEKHYARALALVTSIARSSKDVEVIEWSFGCLAFMFKYLSKLIVPDLRPTYDLMAPLLGKERQQPHITRFAAEAMSFLIRKAGAPAVREKALNTIILHAKSDLLSTSGSRQFSLYYHGIMTIFAEAIKGTGLNIHSSGMAIFHSMVSQFDGRESLDGQQSPWADVICGVLTSLIHHTSSDTLKDVIATILGESADVVSSFTEAQTPQNLQCLMASARTIGVIAGVRKGSRVSDWPALLKSLSKVLDILSQNNKSISGSKRDPQLWKPIVLSTSIVLQYAPVDTLIPFASGYISALARDPLARWFLVFCSYFAEADVERFRDIVLPHFQRFVVAHWPEDDNEDSLCILLPKLASSNALTSNHLGKDGFNLPQSWQDQIVSKFEWLEVSPFPEQASTTSYDNGSKVWHDRCLPQYHALLEILECTAVHPSTSARIAEILLRKLKLALRPSSALAPDEAHFIVGRGFNAFSRMRKGAGEVDVSLGPLLRAAAPRYSRLSNFLKAMLSYEGRLTESTAPSTVPLQHPLDSSKWSADSDGDTDLLIASLVDNLCTDSHDLRLLSLQLLDDRYKNFNGSSSEVWATMLLVEQTPLSLQTSRSTSMHIRKLGSMYKHHTSDLMLSKAIPYFCFGMLTVKFAQIWEDASTTLAQIAETTTGQDTIAELAFRWLETPSTIWDASSINVEQSTSAGLTDFECSNVMKLDDLAREVELQMKNARALMLQKFESEKKLVAAQPSAARAQALRVLAAIPRIAERRSRQLIPMFFSWARNEDSEEVNEEPAVPSSDWTRKDQKSQLDLFRLFTNPKVLYRSIDIYSALLVLLSKGDVDIQKSALKAIFTWNSPSIRPYEENLLNLLDEARFKDEITLLLQGETSIQAQHRPELMPVLLRLLYGRTISRKSAASGKSGMEARRLTVLRNLSNEDIDAFLKIALGKLKHVNLVENANIQESVFERQVLSVRKQLGFVNMMEDVLKELGSKVATFTSKLLSPILYCLVFASRRLQKATDASEDEERAVTQASMLKIIRQTGYKCLVLLFKNDMVFDWSPFLTIILDELVSPRLERLPVETTQGVSGVLQLLSTWSISPKTVLFLSRNKQTLRKIAECLALQKSKDAVKLFALRIIRNIVNIARGSTRELESIAAVVKSTLLDYNMDFFLTQLGNVLRNQQDLSKELLEACVETVSELAPFVSSSTQAHNLVDISVFLLDQPTRRVNPKTKSGLLEVLEQFVPLYDLQDNIVLKDRVYNTVTSLFGFFRDKKSREVLSRVLLVYSRNDPVIEEVATLCADLNSFVEARLDEPDYDRRLQAFTSLVKKRETPFTAHQWRPLLYNMLFYINHDEEFGILSSNSSDGICAFINTASRASENAEFRDLLSSVILPALYSGVREQSEIIRREFVKVMAHLVRTFPNWADVSDMHGLLGGVDEVEASFFNNILTSGKGRQSSALGQLATVATKGELSSSNVSQFFIPLIEHFILDRAEGNDAHSLAAEATSTVGVLAGLLEWPQYMALLRRFIGYITSRPELEKQIIRLLGKVIDALALAAEKKANEFSEDSERPQLEGVQLVRVEETPHANLLPALVVTLPKQAKLTADLSSNILPPLLAYLHDKDESTVSLRVPVAIIVVKLLKLLPQEQMTEKLPTVLTDICHILRSKSQESRDMTRDTLNKICVLLGPSYFGFVLKELRGALARGYQLHVLSYTMHSILVATTPEYSPGDLDYCLPSIVAVIMDDIFGATGQEKDAEEYVSKMKEVKSSKSHDSMELIAKTATLSHLKDLVRPIQVLLREKLNIRMVRKIDDLLNRITTGLLKNTAAESRDSLIFCFEVIQDTYQSSKLEDKVKENYRLKKYLIQRGVSKGESRGSTTVYTYKLVRFAFDVMRSVLKKHENLRTAANLAGFVPIIGDALVEAEDEVKVVVFRLLTTIVKVPLKFTNDGINLYKIAAAEAMRSISSSSSTTSDTSQAALKLISVILRDRSDIKIRDTSVEDLLGKLKEDITDPERRHVTFSFLRAVLDAKVENAAVYDTLDYIGTVMVTNDDKDTRDLARGTYFQFLREYPQKKNRWSKQLAFIVVNLKYEREGGRLSVLEVIHLLLSKSSNDFVQEVSATCFVPLIFVLVNDDSEKCRMAAGEVIKEIFRKADSKRIQTFLGLLRSWINQHENSSIMRLGFLSYGFYYEAQTLEDGNGDVDVLQTSILAVLRSADQLDSDWELTYAALQLTSVLCQKFPTRLLAADTAELWTAVRPCLSYPHAWVKLSSARLMSTYFTDFARANVEDGSLSLPLQGCHGLRLDAEDITDLIRRMANMFKTPGLTELLATEIVKSLVFLGRCAGANDLKWIISHQAAVEGPDDEDDWTESNEHTQQTALEYFFGRLSFILRRETIPPRAPALIPKMAALQLLHILCKKLPAETLSSSLQVILSPLHNLTDPSIPAPYSTDDLFKSGYEAIKADSQELMSLLQNKCGTAEYTAQLLKVRECVKERRNQRSSKRKIEAVTAPEKFGRDKKKKIERKKERRKERGLEHRDRRRGW